MPAIVSGLDIPGFGGFGLPGDLDPDIGAAPRDHSPWIYSEGAGGRRADLSDRDLTGFRLAGVNLTGADLSAARLANANLGGAGTSLPCHKRKFRKPGKHETFSRQDVAEDTQF